MVDVSKEELAANDGASLVGFVQSGTGAIGEDVQSALRRVFALQNFAVGDGVTDDTAAVQAALAEAAATGNVLDGAGATFRLASTINMPFGKPVRMRNINFLIDHTAAAIADAGGVDDVVARGYFETVNIRAARNSSVAWDCNKWQYCQWINCFVGTANGASKFTCAWKLSNVAYWNTFYSPEVERCDYGWDLNDANDTRFFMPRMIDFTGAPISAVLFSGGVSGTAWFGTSFEGRFSGPVIDFHPTCEQNYFYGGRIERRSGGTSTTAVKFNGASGNGLVGLYVLGGFTHITDLVGKNFAQYFVADGDGILQAGGGQFFVSQGSVDASLIGGQTYNTVRNRFTGYLAAYGARDFCMTPAVGVLDMNGETINNVATLVLAGAATPPAVGKVALGNEIAGSTALPATPLGYLVAFVGGTKVKLPYYAA